MLTAARGRTTAQRVIRRTVPVLASLAVLTPDHTPTAPPSLLPAKKYCDITGLHAAYTDPRTKLRYKGLEVWSIVRNLVGPPSPCVKKAADMQGPGVDQSYLALRGAQTSLK